MFLPTCFVTGAGSVGITAMTLKLWGLQFIQHGNFFRASLIQITTLERIWPDRMRHPQRTAHGVRAR